jgi:hypothetical protein
MTMSPLTPFDSSLAGGSSQRLRKDYAARSNQPTDYNLNDQITFTFTCKPFSQPTCSLWWLLIAFVSSPSTRVLLFGHRTPDTSGPRPTSTFLVLSHDSFQRS